MQNMSNLLVFQFEGREVRFVGTTEKLEWVATDIVAILYPQADPRNYSNYLGKVPPAWKGHKLIMTLGGTQKMATLYEPGLYYFISRSDSPIAVPFQQWLYEEVLPSIRKHGFYQLKSSQQQAQNGIIPTLDQLVGIAQKLLATTKLSPELQAIALFRGVEALCPEVAPLTKELVGAVQEVEATPDRHLAPTELGKIYAQRHGLSKPIKPEVVNRVLESADLQTKEVQTKTDGRTGRPKHKNIWHLTEAGKQWGTVIRDKARTHDKIIEHVRWLPDVLDVIDLSIQG
jgi:prophage antirepressor-like protein